MRRKETVIVTGGSQGIGAATVREFLSRGYQVVATSRRVTEAGFPSSPNLALVDGDIGREETAEKVTQTALAKFGLPAAPTPFGNYVEALQTGNLLFLSGMLVDHKPKYVGRLGKELDTEAGRDAAYTAGLSALAAAKEHLGSLDRVTRVVRLGVFIATSGDFFDQPRVADAVSNLFRYVFSSGMTGVRLVIGVASLPLGMPIELEVILEVADGDDGSSQMVVIVPSASDVLHSPGRRRLKRRKDS